MMQTHPISPKACNILLGGGLKPIALRAPPETASLRSTVVVGQRCPYVEPMGGSTESYVREVDQALSSSQALFSPTAARPAVTTAGGLVVPATPLSSGALGSGVVATAGTYRTVWQGFGDLDGQADETGGQGQWDASRVGSFGLVPWIFSLQRVENRLDLGVDGWQVGGDDAVEVDGGRA